MANKDQRGSKEIRKPKQVKAKPAAATSSFVVTAGRNPPGGKSK